MSSSQPNPEPDANADTPRAIGKLEALLEADKKRKTEEALEKDHLLKTAITEVANRVETWKESNFEDLDTQETTQTENIAGLNSAIDIRKKKIETLRLKIKEVTETLGLTDETKEALTQAEEEIKEYEKEITTLSSDLERTQKELQEMKAKHKKIKDDHRAAASDKLGTVLKTITLPIGIDESNLKTQAQAELKRRTEERKTKEDKTHDDQLEGKERIFFEQAKTDLVKLRTATVKLCDEMDALQNPSTQSGGEFNSWMQEQQKQRTRFRENKNYIFLKEKRMQQDQTSAEEVQKEIDEKIDPMIKAIDKANEKLDEFGRKYCTDNSSTLSLNHRNYYGETYRDSKNEQRVNKERTTL